MQAINQFKQKNLPRSKFSGLKQTGPRNTYKTKIFSRCINNLRQTKPIKALRQAQMEILQGFHETGG